MHMVIWLDIVSMGIKRFLYVNLIPVFTNFILEKNTVYLGHRKLIKPNHPYRILQKTFKLEQEFEIASKPLTNDEVYQ